MWAPPVYPPQRDNIMEILRTTVPGQHEVIVQQIGVSYYRVIYGKEVTTFSSLMAAIAEAESCVVHAVACNGLFDED